jgi:hypothetical protein
MTATSVSCVNSPMTMKFSPPSYAQRASGLFRSPMDMKENRE